MIQLETKRLLLRQFLEEDAEAMYWLNADPEVIKYTGDPPFKDVAQSLDLIKNYIQYEKYKMGRLTLIVKETKEVIGWCGLKYHHDSDEVDIGYRIKRSAWGKGYATEAAQVCLKDGFERLKLKTIVGHAMKDNHASINVFKKLGMKYVKDIVCGGQPSVFYTIDNSNH
jgi:ribosomal-protein-alanine N-acetyltransferase